MTVSPVFAAAAAAQSEVPRRHFAMLNDHIRNHVYRQAIESVVGPADLVLDIGTGCGLTAMMAARTGARVVTCEANPTLAELARRIIAANGFGESITVIAKPSTDLVIGRDLPRQADVLVAEIFDCGLVGESALPTYTHAIRELVAPHARLIPAKAWLYGQVVESERLWELNHVAGAVGFDLSLFNELSTAGYFPARLEQHQWRGLSTAALLAEIDFADPAPLDGVRRSMTVTDAGVAHAVVMWFELELARGRRLTNSHGHHSHWHQAVHTITVPEPVRPGESVTVTVAALEPTLRLDIAADVVRATTRAWTTHCS